MIEVLGPDGQVVFSRQDNLAQVIGFFTLPQPAVSAAGSITNDLFLQGTPFYHVRSDWWSRIGYNLTVTFAGNVMSWSVYRTTYYYPGSGRNFAVMTYGVY